MSPRAVAAAFNNAQWCDLVCRTHGAVTAFSADAWVSETRSRREVISTPEAPEYPTYSQARTEPPREIANGR